MPLKLDLTGWESIYYLIQYMSAIGHESLWNWTVRVMNRFRRNPLQPESYPP